MLVLVWPASWVLYIPIALVEAAVARRHLGLSWRRALKVATAANLVSTLVGIPLTWGVGVLAESFIGPVLPFPIHPSSTTSQVIESIVMAPWLGSNVESWMVTLAALSLCVPFFFVSVWAEYLVANWLLHDIEEAGVKGWAWRANGASYGAIAVLLAGLLGWALSS